DDAVIAFAPNGPDSAVDILESERVGGQQVQREAFRGKLGERELARLVAVAACALDGDGLLGHLLDGEIRESGHLPLDEQRASPALERVDAEQDRHDASAGGAVEHDVDTLASGDVHDALKGIFLHDVDDMVST